MLHSYFKPLLPRVNTPALFCVTQQFISFQNNLNPDWKDFLIYESELGTGTNDDIE